MHLTFQLSVKRIILLDKNLSLIKLVDILKKKKVAFWSYVCFSIQMYPRGRSLFFQKKKKKKRKADLCQIPLYYAKSLQKKERGQDGALTSKKAEKNKQTCNYGTDFSNKDPLYEVWARFLFHINLSRSEVALLISVVSTDLYQFFVPWELRVLDKLLVRVNIKG